jgi:glucosamine-phosphate N-acetyltransferase
MSEIQYTQLIDLIEQNPENIERIKEQYLILLSELTSTSYIETSLFIKNIDEINKMGTIVVGVLNDVSNDVSSNNFEIVASGTIIIEPKIMREGRNVGHIEDIVVTKHMRGKGISRKMLDILKVFARESNCYKVTLDCDNEVKNVYIKNGLKVKGVQMAEYF